MKKIIAVGLTIAAGTFIGAGDIMAGVGLSIASFGAWMEAF